MTFARKDSFPHCPLSDLLFNFLEFLGLTRISTTVLNKSGESIHSCIVCNGNKGENIQSITIEYTVSSRILYIFLITLREFPFVCTFQSTFVMNRS